MYKKYEKQQEEVWVTIGHDYGQGNVSNSEERIVKVCYSKFLVLAICRRLLLSVNYLEINCNLYSCFGGIGTFFRRVT